MDREANGIEKKVFESELVNELRRENSSPSRVGHINRQDASRGRESGGKFS
jgi:hypothetical protein